MKQKTRKGVKRRVKITNTGKVIAYRPGRSSQRRAKESGKTVRNLRKKKELAKTFARKWKRVIING